MPNSDTDQESEEMSQEDEDIESQEDSEELPDDPEKLKELLKKERAKKLRVVKDNQKLRTRINGNQTKTVSKKTDSAIPAALVARAQKASFIDALGSETVLDRDLLWLAAKELLEFNDDYEPINVEEVLQTLKKKHAKLFGTRGKIDANGTGSGVRRSAETDNFRTLIDAARGRTSLIGGLGEN